MSRKPTFFIDIGKIIINCLLLPLYFIKIFHHVGYLDSPDGSGSVRVDYIYSIYDNIVREGLAVLLWISIAIIIVSLALSISSIISKDNKKVKVVSHVVFGISLVFFFVLLFLAATIRYKY